MTRPAALHRRLLGGQRLERLQRRLLLGLLLRRAGADPALLAVDQCGARETPVVSRPYRLQHRVDDLLADPGQLLLELRLVVDRVRGGVLHLTAERSDDRFLDRLEPLLEEDRSGRRLEQPRDYVAVLREAGQPLRLRRRASL